MEKGSRIALTLYAVVGAISVVVASSTAVIPISAYHLYQEPCDVSPGCGFSSKKQCFEWGKIDFAFHHDRQVFNEWKKECRHQ